MRVRLVQIADRGIANQERVHLSVLQDATLAFYVVLATYFSPPDRVMPGTVAAYWFPTQLVKPGDQVVLFTGAGTPQSRREPNGTTTHFYYWGMSKTLFNHPNARAVLVEAENWSTSLVG